MKIGDEVTLTQKWAIGDLIANGGFGQVFHATNVAGTRAALKIVPKVPGADRELLFADLPPIPNVLPVLDHGDTDEFLVLVMPLAERSLRDQLDGTPIEGAALTDLLLQVANGLAGLNSQVVHRDLKPENLLLFEGAWCISDFGIARYAEASTAADTRKFSLSPSYASPEQWRSEHATQASDVYSFGVIAFELATGHLPFDGKNYQELRHQHLHSDPPKLTGVSPALGALVTECLIKAPQARPSAANIHHRLQNIQNRTFAGGLANLQTANEAEIQRRARAHEEASRQQTESERREGLLDASAQLMDSILGELSDAILAAAPATKSQDEPVARRRFGQPSGLKLKLGEASLTTERVSPADVTWGGWERPKFDVIAQSSLTVRFPRYSDYEGRSHSLWYCDAENRGEYAWYETAFMCSGLSRRRSTIDPFSLDTGEEAAKAVWNGMAEFQVAWPFTRLDIGGLYDFIDRWAGWLAKASNGGLAHPSTMPEKDPQGSWRR